MDAVFLLKAALGLDTSEYDNGLKEAKESAEGAGSKIAKGLGTAATVVGAGVTAAAGAVAALGKSAIDAGSKYETAFAQVQTIMDSTQMSTDDMSSGLMQLSNAMGISTEELSGTVYNAISATGDTANALSLAEKASKLATAGFTDTGSALSVLTTAMNAYGLEAEEAENISDSLIMVQNLGVTTVSELASSMGKAIASASAYGVNLGNVESAYVSMTKSGISTAESTTYMASMMKELGDSGSDVAEIIQNQTGKSFSELMADGGSLGDVLGVLYESVNGDTTALMNLWGSAEAGKAANAILSQGLEQFNENLETIQGTSGATQTAFEVMEDTMSNRMQKAQNAWQNMLAAVTTGDDITVFVDDFVGQISSLADSFLPMAETTISGVVSLVTELAPKIIELLPGIAESILPNLLDSAISLFLETIDVLINSLPMLTDVAFNAIITLADGLAASMPQMVPSVIDVILKMVETLTNPDSLSMLIGAALRLIVELSVGLVKAIPQIVASIPTIIVNIVKALMRSGPEIANAGFQLFIGLGTGMVDAVASIVNKAKEVAGKVVSAVKGFFGIHSPSKVFAGLVIS